MTDKPRVEKQLHTRIMDRYRDAAIYIPGVPSLIRGLLIAKAEWQYRHGHDRTPSAQVDAWLTDKRVFFGFGLFRSGTTFLANMLNETVADAVVQHEANVNDYWFYTRALRSPQQAQAYIDSYRLAELQQRLRDTPCRRYGEISPFLRRHAAALRQQLPEAPMFHLVRGGRAVVRSLMSRELFAPHDPMSAAIRPPHNDPYAAAWSGMSRFERLCWLWAADNRYLREQIGHLVQFERLLVDYDYFDHRIARHLGLHIDQADWAVQVARVKNPTPRYRVSEFEDWPSAWREAFERICGDEMTACGYW